MYENRHIARNGIFPIAGWLFADLFLALTIIFIATSIPGRPLAARNTLRSSPTLTKTVKPASSQQIQALSTVPQEFTVTVDPLTLHDANTISYVKETVIQQLDQKNNGQRKVGFVLTFAGANNLESPNIARDNAKKFNAIVGSLPSFHGAIFENYHDLDTASDSFDLIIYFFVDV